MAYELEIHYIDVGQGDCTLIVIREERDDPDPHSQFDQRIIRTVLIDCGTTSLSSAFQNSPENSLLEKLDELRVEGLSIVIVSHYDEDHYSGIVALLNRAIVDPGIRRLFHGTKLYDQGIVFRKNIDIGFRDFKLQNDRLLPGFNLIHAYTSSIAELNKNHHTGIQRMSQRIFTGHPEDYDYGHWNSAPHAQYDPVWETGVFDNTRSQGVLIQEDLWEPTDFEEGHYAELELGGIPFYSVSTLPCHHFVGTDLLNHGFDLHLAGMELWCTAANGYTYQHEIDDFTPQLAYLGSGNWNKFSLGMLLRYNGFSHWFGGDLESEQEERCAAFILEVTQGERLSVMKASHHGSNASTSSDFLTGLNPELVIISCGNWSQHGHPHIEVIRRLTQMDSRPNVVMTNAPVYPNLQYGIVPSFYNPGGINTQFYISGSSLEEVIGNISIRLSSAGRTITYWEQNHLFEILSNDHSPVFQAGTSISMARFLELLDLELQHCLTDRIDHNGFTIQSVLIDTETGDITGWFEENLLYVNSPDNVFGRISGNAYTFPF